VIDADRNNKNRKRRRKHENLLSAPRGYLCLLHRDAMLGGPSQ
jgi:hypothetical protein